jgi:hypothetical protein
MRRVSLNRRVVERSQNRTARLDGAENRRHIIADLAGCRSAGVHAEVVVELFETEVRLLHEEAPLIYERELERHRVIH